MRCPSVRMQYAVPSCVPATCVGQQLVRKKKAVTASYSHTSSAHLFEMSGTSPYDFWTTSTKCTRNVSGIALQKTLVPTHGHPTNTLALLNDSPHPHGFLVQHLPTQHAVYDTRTCTSAYTRYVGTQQVYLRDKRGSSVSPTVLKSKRCALG